MGRHLELSLVTEYNDGRVWAEPMLTRQRANEVRIDRGGQMGGGDQGPGPKFSLLKEEANQDGARGTDPVAALPPVHPNIPGLNLPNNPPPQQLLGLMETIY